MSHYNGTYQISTAPSDELETWFCTQTLPYSSSFFWSSSYNHLSKPPLLDLANHGFSLILLWTMWFNNVIVDSIFLSLCHEFSAWFYLFKKKKQLRNRTMRCWVVGHKHMTRYMMKNVCRTSQESITRFLGPFLPPESIVRLIVGRSRSAGFICGAAAGADCCYMVPKMAVTCWPEMVPMFCLLALPGWHFLLQNTFGFNHILQKRVCSNWLASSSQYW
jgi:hypothetical protein